MCIMDEAGQITLPAVLGALLRARTFCLVVSSPPPGLAPRQNHTAALALRRNAVCDTKSAHPAGMHLRRARHCDVVL